ncbi:hypothetical protein Tco_1144711 [Tanacetum coccineum]
MWDRRGELNGAKIERSGKRPRKTEGVWVSDPGAIKMAFLEFYKEKFSCHDSPVILPSMSSAKSLTRPLALPGPEQNTDLQLGGPGFSTPYAFNPSPKKPRSSPAKRRHNFDLMLM